MDFRYKAYAQQVFSRLPWGEKVNFRFQKYITRTIPVSDRVFISGLRLAQSHYLDFKKYNRLREQESLTSYEFGAGWDLINPLGLSLLGIKLNYCVDIKEQVFPDVIADSIARLYTLKDSAPFDYSLPGKIEVTGKNWRTVLRDYFGIIYKAPVDARDTGLPAESIDFIPSNCTFEHLPGEDIVPILNECYRLLKKGGIVCICIGSGDHWSYFDKSISIYNFLQYSPESWQRYNPSLHFQNRLRHKDYMRAISRTAFEIAEESKTGPSEEELNALKSLELDDYFKSRYTIEELAVKSSKIVLRK